MSNLYVLCVNADTAAPSTPPIAKTVACVCAVDASVVPTTLPFVIDSLSLKGPLVTDAKRTT